MVGAVLTVQDVWNCLESIKDPEVPALSIVELKIARGVHVDGDKATVEISPTFVGCPALELIAGSIHEKLLGMGFKTVDINKSYTAQWSTDMLDETAREKLQTFGIAPPDLAGSVSIEVPTVCPYCKSTETQLENPFGATLCKQLYYCNSCRQSFEKFKTL